MAFTIKPQTMTFTGEVESTYFEGDKKKTDKFSVVFKKKKRSELEQLSPEETLKEVVVSIETDFKDENGNLIDLKGQEAIDAVLDDTNAFMAIWGVYNKSMGIAADDAAKKFTGKR